MDTSQIRPANADIRNTCGDHAGDAKMSGTNADGMLQLRARPCCTTFAEPQSEAANPRDPCAQTSGGASHDPIRVFMFPSHTAARFTHVHAQACRP